MRPRVCASLIFIPKEPLVPCLTRPLTLMRSSSEVVWSAAYWDVVHAAGAGGAGPLGQARKAVMAVLRRLCAGHPTLSCSRWSCRS
jgi:hypothetical protein